MKRTSNAYKQAIAKRVRNRSFMVVSVGVISNEAQSGAAVNSETLYLSDNSFLFKNNDIQNEYASFEENQTLADGSQIFPPENNEFVQLASNIACISKDILGSITVAFDNTYRIKGLTIDFGKDYPTEFEIVINGETTYTYQNASNLFVTESNFDDVNTITITPLHFVNGDNKRLRITRMLMGVGIVFNNSDIQSASFTDETSFVSEFLPQIDFAVTCFDKNKRFNVDDNNSFIQFLQVGQAINITIGIELDDGTVEWVDMPITYIDSWSSNDSQVSFRATDRIVFFKDKYDQGNYIHERTLYDDALAIFQFIGLEPDEYYIDDVLRNITVRNPLPITSCANCLQLIANAGRCALKEDVNGRIIFIPNFENIVEPTDINVLSDSEAAWSKPINIRTGSSIIYADFTQDFVSADGSMFFLPENGENYLETGYVSDEIADSNGNFITNPSVSLELPAAFTYYGVHIDFGGNPPQEIIIRTYNSDELLDEMVVSNPDKNALINNDFFGFDRMQIEITKGHPNNRAVIQKVSFGNLTDYRLLRQDMKQNPLGTVEPKVKSVNVRVMSYVEPSEEGMNPTLVDDNVYYTETIGSIGEEVTISNPLISTMEHAEKVAKWLGNYYANNVTYSVEYRGEPRIESLDYIFMDSNAVNNLQVEVESHTLNFNGSLSGQLKLRRAVDMINS